VAAGFVEGDCVEGRHTTPRSTSTLPVAATGHAQLSQLRFSVVGKWKPLSTQSGNRYPRSRAIVE